jgi:predicted PhzF superfamily epimerase YddE/YHI9
VEVVRDSGPREKADYLAAVFESEAAVRAVAPDFRALAGVEQGYITITGPGESSDLASRFFGPGAGIDEDPVTGSVHCLLAPYWAERLGKPELFARQVSARGGELWCTVGGERVRIEGHAVTYMEGTIEVP